MNRWITVRSLFDFSFFEVWLTRPLMPPDTQGSILHLRVCMGIYKPSEQTTTLALLQEMQWHTWMSKQFQNVWWRRTWSSHPAVLNTSEMEVFLRKVLCTACAIVDHALRIKGHLVVTAWSCSRLLTWVKQYAFLHQNCVRAGYLSHFHLPQHIQSDLLLVIYKSEMTAS